MKQTLITARSNPWVQKWLRYHSKPSVRKAAGLIWLEGEHLAMEALKQTTQTHAVPRFTIMQWIVPNTLAGQAIAAKLYALAQHEKHTTIDVVYLSESVYKTLCSMDSLPSVCAVLRETTHMQAIDYTAAAVVLDGLQDPGNIGTAIRLCAAFGVPQVLLAAGCASSWSAKALRAGQGAQLSVPVHENLDLAIVYQGFLNRNTPIWATSLSKESITLDKPALAGMTKQMLWVFGNEGQGISALSQAVATQCVHISMQGGFESLNVASAVAICLWAWQENAR
jgi:RNA methyltransferase, TrmH family